MGTKSISLETALALSDNNVTGMLVKLYTNGKVGFSRDGDDHVYTAQNFIDEWPKGGKHICEAKWRDTAFSLTRPKVPGLGDFYASFDEDGEAEADEPESRLGKHEWIPTNMLGYVVEHGIVRHRQIRWVYLAEVLRVPTTIVVLHPSKGRYAASTGDPFGLTGHVEAIFLKGPAKYKGRTKGQAGFHDVLRGILKTHLNDNVSDPVGYFSALMTHVSQYYWTGDLASAAVACGMSATDFAKAPCPYHYKSDSGVYSSWGATMAEMGERLTREWAVQAQLLLNWQRALLSF